ncbi:tRNA (adenine-N(6)-)-methyltransferase [Brumimicrobium salinarum]|uniref:tRNA (Adenine-N(6)-)-methyltransferase n=1 Tax=Brumimicrobium salinarum TaxID=2058658 RepID=A0A2I0R1E7_9FLAO|nr:methyltransferase [Brumimicrobium salinarum]PKR80411.1 tRNA (adenine-N(6)-)-methyltransferase [Brumimicrobium salinarum]
MSVFKFKAFNIHQAGATQKVGTDAMVLGASLKFTSAKNILDVGTGTGVIALMLAQYNPSAEITGLDINSETTKLADYNFKNSGFLNNFRVVNGDFLSYKPEHQFDLIVSNPPFFKTKMPSRNKLRSLARHEGEMTVEKLVLHATKLLTSTGELWLILPQERTDALLKFNEKLTLVKRIKIFGKPNHHVRDILALSKENGSGVPEVTSLTIRNLKNEYTEAYKTLTKEFHFNKL